MAVDGVGGTNSTNSAAQTQAANSRSSLGQDAFLQLLTTQLAHQDPTAPQDNGEMIAQMAQFSSLEQLTQMNKTLTAVATALGVKPTTSSDQTSDSTTGTNTNTSHGTTGA
jgi:flagellar basal-body rod modification protein FlgD